MKEAIKKILDISDKTYYNWKNQNRPIISLLELCFNERELESFLKNLRKPYKIAYADRNYLRLSNNLIEFIVFSKATKAFFSILFNNKMHPNKNIDENVLNEYQSKRIDNYDLINYFNNKPNTDLLLYVYENMENDWLLFRESIETKWILEYFEILKLSIEKNIFDEIFGDPNKDIEECIVPIPPQLFASYENNILIEEKYLYILLEIKESIIDGTFQELPKYSPYDQAFNLKTVSIKE
ncbi:hypothetical protein CPG38_03740 [Malaciobacter marinus]|uniref:hypothetical protein n=1 Tax=Malaciobacter marinus TaxID=505249 RepID=UPI000C0695F8|nr:hypothetical protein [Malaciobacter marinus]PHO13318.1 hypothetical protein CPG38_03740 [Malaciobacter marinus]